jgi:hypothetical protein
LSLDNAKHKLKKAGPQGLPFFVGSGHPESYPQLGSFRFFAYFFDLRFCVFGVKIHNWPQKNWVRSENDAHFSTIGFDGFVWVQIGFRRIFCIHFRSLFGFRMVFQRIFRSFFGFSVDYLCKFEDYLCKICNPSVPSGLKPPLLKAGRIYFSKNHGGPPGADKLQNSPL